MNRQHVPGGTRFIALWAAPRSVSTAFEKTFTCRADTRVVHEPFTDCYYFGHDRHSKRYGDRRSEFTAAEVTAELLTSAAPVVFTKDLAFQAEPYLTDVLLRTFTHTFIIRHPGAVLRSLTPLKPDFTEDEYGFLALARLCRRVVDLGRTPIVVDGDDFRRRPRAVLAAYCGAVGVTFDESMLHWENGRIREWRAGEEQSQAKWHRTLEASHRILPPDGCDPVPVPPGRTAMYRRACRIYDDMSRFALSPTTTVVST
jgi:hypothetical protein